MLEGEEAQQDRQRDRGQSQTGQDSSPTEPFHEVRRGDGARLLTKTVDGQADGNDEEQTRYQGTFATKE
jgi:hypothetical protein